MVMMMFIGNQLALDNYRFKMIFNVEGKSDVELYYNLASM